MCWPGQLCSTTIFELKCLFDTHISPLTGIAQSSNLKFTEGRIAVSINYAALWKAILYFNKDDIFIKDIEEKHIWNWKRITTLNWFKIPWTKAN